MFVFQLSNICIVIFISIFFLSTTFLLQQKISIEKTDTCFFPVNDTFFDFTKHLKLFLWLKFIKKMQEFLSLLEKPPPEASETSVNWNIFFWKSLSGTTFLLQNRPINLLALRKKEACLTDIIKSFIKNIMGQVIFICLLVCVAVCCL